MSKLILRVWNYITGSSNIPIAASEFAGFLACTEVTDFTTEGPLKHIIGTDRYALDHAYEAQHRPENMEQP